MRYGVFLLVAAALLAPAALSAAGNEVHVTGSAMFRINDTVRNFAFNAHVDKDGNVRGQGTLHNRDQTVRMHLEIDCLRVEGNVATMSGYYTQSTDPELDGAPIWFRAVDNGEGKEAPRDQITLVVGFYSAGVPCTDEYPLDLIPLEGGSIRIHE